MDPVSPVEVLSLKETAARLGVTRVRVRQLVIAGKISKHGTSFLRKDVEALAKDRGAPSPRVYTSPKTEAAIALKAFDLFKAGHTLHAVMRDLDLTPQKVRTLYREFSTPLGKAPPPSEDQRAQDEARFAADFDREQDARRKKNAVDHAARMRDLQDRADRGKKEKNR